MCEDESSYPKPALVLRNRLLLTADDGRHGRELWTTDGTRQGTQLFFDLNPLRSLNVPPFCEEDSKPRTDIGLSSNPEGFVALGDVALFTANDGTTGRELWRTDGTPRHTRRVVDLRPGPLGSEPHGLVVFHGQVYFFAFFASAAGSGEALWRTDGTARGTVLVRDLALGGLPSWGRDLTVAGDRLFFTVYNETTGAELWTSGGDAASTPPVRDLNPGPASASPQELTSIDGILVFAADDGLAGLEPWRSDGTPAGTFPLADLAPGPAPSSPGPFTRIGQLLITGADDGTHGREPWAIPLADVLTR
jgi:ELWxxDGT repeat protein